MSEYFTRDFVTLTGFSGGKYDLLQNEVEVGWIQALTWDNRNKPLKGRLVFVKIEDLTQDLFEICITLQNEQGEKKYFKLLNVRFPLEEGVSELHRIYEFEADDIIEWEE